MNNNMYIIILCERAGAHGDFYRLSYLDKGKKQRMVFLFFGSPAPVPAPVPAPAPAHAHSGLAPNS